MSLEVYFPSRHTLGPTWLVFGASFLAAVVAQRPAFAQSTCAVAYEEAQEAQRGGALLRSQANLRLCMRTCPKKLVDDCGGWLRDVDDQLPSIVIEVTDAAGHPQENFRISVDGAPLSTEALAAPIDLDPGRHELKVEGALGARGSATITLSPREKKRVVSLRLPHRSGPPLLGDPTPTMAPSPSPMPYVLGGVGLGGVVAGIVLGIKGQVEKSQLAGSCAPYCTKSDADAISAEWLAGGVAAGAGGAMLGAATAWWLLQDHPKPGRGGVSIVPIPWGLAAVGSF